MLACWAGRSDDSSGKWCRRGDMRLVMLLLHGRDPVPIIVTLIYLVGGIVGTFVWMAAPGGWQGILLTLLAVDWSAGIVANATRSTRAYYAELPMWVPVLFVAVHLAEIPLVLWASGGSGLGEWMLLLLGLKLAVFVAGQIKLRRQA